MSDAGTQTNTATADNTVSNTGTIQSDTGTVANTGTVAPAETMATAATISGDPGQGAALSPEQQAGAAAAHSELTGADTLRPAATDPLAVLDEMAARFDQLDTDTRELRGRVDQLNTRVDQLNTLGDRVAQLGDTVAHYQTAMPLDMIDRLRTLRDEFDAVVDHLRVFHRDIPVVSRT